MAGTDNSKAKPFKNLEIITEKKQGKIIANKDAEKFDFNACSEYALKIKEKALTTDNKNKKGEYVAPRVIDI